MPRWLPWLVCALGAALIVVGLRMSRAAGETWSYARTRGRIVRAEVEERRAASEEGGSQFTPVVRYAFEAHGRTYESERVAVGAPAGPPSPDPQDARRLVERYRAGTEVDVWFDPRDPRRSVLVRGVARSQVVLTVALGVLLLGAGMFVLGR